MNRHPGEMYVRITYPSVRDGKATNDLCKLIKHGFGTPVIWAEHGVDRVGHEHPLVSVGMRQLSNKVNERPYI